MHVAGTEQELVCGDARNLSFIDANSIHLVVTSPPYYNVKSYENGGLGSLPDVHEWLCETARVWREVYRVLCPGRRFFLNIMNLPVSDGMGYRTLNLTGESVRACEELGFIFKRDIVWHKTHGVKAHFGTYPEPGGILLNNMHEFILEFEKPWNGKPKYEHVTHEQRADSQLSKEFWLSIKNSDVWQFAPESNRKHIAPFPEELPRRLIKAYSFVGETILDPFVGSGTTSVAAARLGRNAIGVDISEKYLAIARERLQIQMNLF